MEKLIKIRNWIGKFFLLALGMLLLAGIFYADLLEMFKVSDDPVPEWSKKDSILLVSGLAFLIGGVFLNNMLDAISSAFKSFANKISN